MRPKSSFGFVPCCACHQAVHYHSGNAAVLFAIAVVACHTEQTPLQMRLAKLHDNPLYQPSMTCWGTHRAPANCKYLHFANCSQNGHFLAGYAYGNTAANAKETLIFSAILVMVVRTAVWAFMHVLQKRFEYVALQRQLMMGKNSTANGLTPAPTPHIELTPLMRGAWIVSLPSLLPADSLVMCALCCSKWALTCSSTLHKSCCSHERLVDALWVCSFCS